MKKYKLFKNKHNKKIKFKIWTLINKKRNSFFNNYSNINLWKHRSNKNEKLVKYSYTTKKIFRSVFNMKSKFLIYRRFKHYYPVISTKKLLEYYNKSKRSTGNLFLDFISNLECRLDVFLYRSKFAKSLGHARQIIVHRKIIINNKRICLPGYSLKYGDIIRFLNINQIVSFEVKNNDSFKSKHMLFNKNSKRFLSTLYVNKKKKMSIFYIKNSLKKRHHYIYITKKLTPTKKITLSNYLDMDSKYLLKMNLFKYYFLSLSNNIYDSKLCAFFFLNSFSPIRTQILSVLLK